MSIVFNNQVAVEQMYDKVERRELIGKGMGAKSITMGEITIQPGGIIPLHRHSVDDCVLLRAGEGEIHIDGEVMKLKSPMSILIPAGVKHKVLNTGATPMRIIYAFPSIEVDRQLL
jgi:quercetin dioxygenase-like cupin family protein